MGHILVAAAAAGTIAGLAGWLRLLSYSGAIAAFVVGLVVFGLGGFTHAAVLVAFFVSCSLLSRLGRARKAGAAAFYDKGSRRDAWQVAANGGVPAVLAFLCAVGPEPRKYTLLFLAALAAATADTWATELGGLWRGRPRLISNLRPVEAGTSGAVSWVGLLAAVAGAAFVVLIGRVFWPERSEALLWTPDGPELMAMAWAGFCASIADSILGASIQAQYRCAKCGKTVERSVHCEQAAKLVRGLPWFSNDIVNLACSLVAVLFAWVLMRFFLYPIM